MSPSPEHQIEERYTLRRQQWLAELRAQGLNEELLASFAREWDSTFAALKQKHYPTKKAV